MVFCYTSGVNRKRASIEADRGGSHYSWRAGSAAEDEIAGKERRILTAKITEESDMETKIDYDGNENRASRTDKEIKEEQAMKTMKRKHTLLNRERD